MSIAAQSAGLPSRAIRVSIVDDSVVVRGLLSRWLAEAGGIEVISTHRNGAEAVAAIDRMKPDVILLDIEMPDMDGITALPLLLRKRPSTTVIVASTLTTRNADVSLRCLQLGAIDYVAKPSTNRDLTFSADFRREIIDKIRVLGGRTLRGLLPRSHGLAAPASRGEAAPPAAQRPIALRPPSRSQPRLLAIGASTGGPNAVAELLKHCLPTVERLPVVVVQHMPAMFTTMFADHLRRQLSVDAREARSGEPLLRNRVYVAPGGRHLRFAREGADVITVVDDAPPVNFCRPSVDVTFTAASQIYGAATLAVMLTGMGADGLAGASALVEAGGTVLAQDEASSIVWGMPGAVAKKGLCAAVDSLAGLARIVNASQRLPA
jgi:two-component system chemotaxis response regulator CheB